MINVPASPRLAVDQPTTPELASTETNDAAGDDVNE